MSWTPSARANLLEIFDYLATRSFDVAVDQEDRILAAAMQLAEHPHLGRPGRFADTRERVVVGSPYVVIYRIRGRVVEVVRVLHGAQRWPPE